MFAKNRGLAVIQIGLIGLTALLCVILASCVKPAGKVQAGSDSFKIVSQGQPAATIIIGEKATGVEEFAASELQKYIKQISGASLPINKDNEDVQGSLILIGNKENNARIAQLGGEIKISSEYPGKEGFIIRVVDNNLVLAGSDSSGALYSVYDLLETLGCRWFFPPSPLWEIIPCGKDVSVEKSINKAEKPDFKNREVWQGVGQNYNWLAKNRGNHLVIPWWEWNDQKYAEYLKEGRKRNISLEVGHDQTINFWLPVDKYFGEHPEYYPLIDGKRFASLSFAGGKQTLAQFCFSSEEGAREVAGNIRKFMDKYPAVATVGLGISDEKLGKTMCQCDACQILYRRYRAEGSSDYSGAYMFFGNKVAGMVAKYHPEVKIRICAYEYACVIDAPVDIKPEKNLQFIFYLFMRDGARPVNSSASGRNKYLLSEFNKWRKIFGDENTVIADYYYGMSRNKDCMWPILEVISRDFSYFKQAGIRGASLSPGWLGADSLNTYLFFRYAWNAAADLDAILDDFCAKAFGEAAAPMRRYLELLIEGMRNVDFSRAGGLGDERFAQNAYLPFYRNLPALLNEELLHELEKRLNQAKEKAKDENVFKRIFLLEKEFKYNACYVRINDIKHTAIRLLSAQQYKKASELCDSALSMLKEAENLKKDFSKNFSLDPSLFTAYQRLAKERAEGCVGPVKEKVALYMPVDGRISRGTGAILRTFLEIKDFRVEIVTDLSVENLSRYRYLVFGAVTGKAGGKDSPWVENLRDYVMKHGGGVYFQHASCGYKPHNWILGDSTVFPEVCKGVKAKTGGKSIDEDKRLIVSTLHALTSGYKTGDEGRHAYRDHMALIKGEKGEVVVIDRNKDPVVIAGKVGKGKVVFDGTIPFDDKTEAEVEKMTGIEKDILINSIKWFCEKDESGNE